MIGYCCKYTPIELLTAFGAKPAFLDTEEKDFEVAESLTHSNLCCHAKALIQQGLKQEELVLMDCCDSIRRAGDIFKDNKKQKYFQILDLPHENGQCAKTRLKHQLLRLAQFYSEYTGMTFDRKVFLEACKEQRDSMPDTPFLAVMGARISSQLLDEIQKTQPLPVVNLTCSGNRYLEEPPKEADTMGLDELMSWYAAALLRMPPCMRMTDLVGRRSLTENPMLKGIIYNTIKFCDYYGFEYAELKKATNLPILKIESDYMPQPAGQLATRLEAFTETLNLDTLVGKKMMNQNRKKQGLFAGIDSGSTTTNLVVINERKEMVASAIVRTGAKAQNGAKAALDKVCMELEIRPEELMCVYATGYGRNNIPFADETKTEITCHARGAYFLNPETRTIVDIGGQDSKVICLDREGGVTGFIMNDKCAAGTGRFLEMMARTLELDMEEMSQRGLKWKNDLNISSMCTVFAESEVISLIADNHSESDIIHGLNKSIASKTASMVKRAKGSEPYMMTGGVARNKGVVKELEAKLGEQIYIAEEPDLCGALGAALFALEENIRTE